MFNNSTYFQRMTGRNGLLEDRLLQFYITIELVWALANGTACLIIGMPLPTTICYFSLFFSLCIYCLAGFLFHIERILKEIYFILVYITIPIMWYLAGGGRTSASILFVCQMIIYVMCMKGKKQKVFVILSLISSGMIQRVSQQLPVPVMPMTQMQYQLSGAVLGLSTTIIIGLILMKQKAEYARERDAALLAEKELERSNSLQKNFLANMSHEIRSPLGIVMGFNNLIKDSDDIEQIHEYSRDITQAGATLLTVINDILDYSKIESGKLDIIEDNYSFNSLMEDIRRDIGLKCDEKGLQFVVKIDERIPNALYGDNIRVKQCLINVLSNAVKYTEQGVVMFTVTRGESSDQTVKLIFSVKDTGKGISENALPNIFTAFQRLDEGMNRGIEGTGLGMAITKNLLDEMGGSISVDSTLGKGSTFVITVDQRNGNIDNVNTNISEGESLSGIRVLVVDDTRLNLTLVKKLLEKEGAIVKTIDNGKDCLADVNENKYDLILLDHMMPEMNGVEVFERMKEQGGINADTPVVMLTANAMAGASYEYMHMGFDGYLSKPIVQHELKETVIRLGKHEA